ncbi:4-hydroxythreonine-4-phosphate dehydrogenase PdxA [Opitutus terrae]|uniref:4-hydroxythreonine-4-phosphate dehydrogenase n=1 Tax=Opitutus terrae (strain DSM 11246 / JCM 15787 / PB90-1) TaxID=452637 RepID=B1ZNR3_OPITP|nr:4-hydroxythreonine-4-phosphate dehydrogenase PdxA [Opitutus terrae]ACB75433.1 4-hydroxythreonine-4-phosphate dehydrogenase [Opitutus terrae PB90-1]
MTKSALPRIAVTMGDPAGIGPETCLRLLNNPELAQVGVPVVFGDVGVLRRVSALLGIPFYAPILKPDTWTQGFAEVIQPSVLDLGLLAADDVVPGRVDARCGEAAFRSVIAAIEAALAGQVDAVATAPLNKEAMHLAGHNYPGHTEIFAERMRAARSCMMLTSPELTCSFVTVHVGYGEVPALLNVPRIVDVIELTAEAMQRIRGRAPRLAVCGLNPHAGEHGLFGQREEERFIAPAIAAARSKGIEVIGPLPPDTAFLASRRKQTDAFVCMYHDQGHIPLKALAFDSAINTTLGLPVIRTSVDHGTAFDIAWQGRANPNSLFEAVRLAAKLSAKEPATHR